MPRGRKEVANHKPDAEREQELSHRHFGNGQRVDVDVRSVQ